MNGFQGLQGISTIQPQGRLESIKGGLSPRGKDALDELIERKGPAAIELMLSILPGSGEIVSAQESAEFATQAYEDIGQGKIGAGLRGLGGSFMSAAGALPVVGGLARLTKRSKKLSDLGFSKLDFFHGTAGDIKGAGFDLNRAGETGTKIADEGVFVTTSPEAAAKYAELASERRFKPANILPLKVRPGKTGIIESVEGLGQLEVKGALLDAKEAGFDSVVLKNYPHPDGIVADTMVVFDPARLRSRFAKFDPKKIQKNELLAGVAPFILLGAPMIRERQTQENKIERNQ